MEYLTESIQDKAFTFRDDLYCRGNFQAQKQTQRSWKCDTFVYVLLVQEHEKSLTENLNEGKGVEGVVV